MKQVVQNFRTGELKVEDVPPPLIRHSGVLVRTAFSLISAGTERSTVKTGQSSLIGKIKERPDLVRQGIESLKREGVRATYQKVKSRLDQVKALGYSAAGTVVEVGEGAGEFKVGDRVACAGVGYASHAEVIFVPKNLCALVPDDVSLDAACYGTVGAIAVHGIHQAGARFGETVAVIGLGLVGQLTVQILKAAGCNVIGVDIDSAACELAVKSGADVVCADPASAANECSRFTRSVGVDSVMITAHARSSEPISLAADLARDRARVVVVGLVGMDLPRDRFYAKELELRLSRSYGPGRYDLEYEEKGTDYPIGYVRWTEKRNIEAFLGLISAGKVNTALLTTHRFPVEEARRAYDVIVKGPRSSDSKEENGGVGQGSFRCGVLLEYPINAIPEPAPVYTKDPAVKRIVSDGDVGISFIGAGNFARGVLLPIVKRCRGVKLIGVAAATGLSAKNTAGQFGFSYAASDYQKILDDESVHAVFIATRHDSHARLAETALIRGKSVFVEKPLAIDEEELAVVAAQACGAAGVLMVGYNRRFAPIAQDVKQRFSRRDEPFVISYRINAGQLPADHWALDEKEGGGRIIGEVCHFVDFIQFLTDSLPQRVFATRVSQNAAPGFADDSVAISLDMKDGSIASILYAAGGDASAGKERIEVFCGRSVAVIDDFKAGSFISGGRAKTIGGKHQDKGHQAEIQAFINAVRGHSEPPIGIESVVATSLSTFAVLKSLRTGSPAAVDVGSVLRT